MPRRGRLEGIALDPASLDRDESQLREARHRVRGNVLVGEIGRATPFRRGAQQIQRLDLTRAELHRVNVNLL